MSDGLLKGFIELYGYSADWCFFAPGRVNIIGEHIDYNGGLVMPCALGMGTYVAIKKRNDDKIRLASKNAEVFVETTLRELTPNPAHHWANYPKAVVLCLLKMGFNLKGFDMYFSGDLPSGAGLSSSASLCAVVAFSLRIMYGLPISREEAAHICQNAEAINGVNCGLMDPFASLLCKSGYALLLNCTTGEYSQVPLALGEYRLVIANTNKPRSLLGSEYNNRRSECEAALKDLKKALDIKNLCDLSPEDFFAHRHVIMDDISKKRAEHAVLENARVKMACEFAAKGNWKEFASLMRKSHESLRDLYEVSCRELDSLVKHAYDFGETANPIYGARMTGAGFGGCTVNIVHKEDLEAFKKYVGSRYTEDTALAADFYEAVPDDGARRLAL